MPRPPLTFCAVALTLLTAGMAACGSQTESPQASSNPEKSTKRLEEVQPPKVSSAQQQLAADMELSSKVKQVLQEPEKSHVEVASSDGVVTLYGTVPAPSDKDRIALLAMDVEGVRSVVNNLVVLRGAS